MAKCRTTTFRRQRPLPPHSGLAEEFKLAAQGFDKLGGASIRIVLNFKLFINFY